MSACDNEKNTDIYKDDDTKPPTSDINNGEFEFSLSDDCTYYIVTSIGDISDNCISIPVTYNDIPVTAIEDCAFELL